jgi:membrane protein YdbS with pleckstrin-like domain
MDNPLKRNSLLGMVSAPVIWVVHLAASYVAVSLICAGGYTEPLFYGIGAAEAIVGAVTLAAVALVVYIGAVNYRRWRRTPRQETVDHGMSRFFTLCSVLLCGLSVVAIFWVAFPAFILPSCAA